MADRPSPWQNGLRARLGPKEIDPAHREGKTTASSGPAEAPRPNVLVPQSQPTSNHRKRWSAAKENLHGKLVGLLDLSSLKNLSEEEFAERLRVATREFVRQNIPPEFLASTEQMAHELYDELIGLGPLESILKDESINEVMVNGPDRVYIEKNGKILLTQVKFRNEAHLRQAIDRIVSRAGRRIDQSSPMVNARLPDGSRVNAVIPPASFRGPALTIRRFPRCPLIPEDLLRLGSATMEMLQCLREAVEGSLNIIVTGGTASGKTTLLNIISRFIPPDERIITIEDTIELQLQQEHVISLEARIPNIEGKGEITIRDLLKNALRMRPDRLVIGECRGGEAFDMLQAMNTGHDGSMSTLHANSPRDAIARLTAMALMAGIDIPERIVRQQIASAVDLIVHLDRLPDGSRKMTHITQIAGMDGDMVATRDIFASEGLVKRSAGRILLRRRAKWTGPRPGDEPLFARMDGDAEPRLSAAQ